MTRRLEHITYRAGWSAVRALPELPAYQAAERLGELAFTRGGAGVTRMRRNYALVRPELSAPALEALVEDGMRAYARYWCDLLRSPCWRPAEVPGMLRTENESQARAALGEMAGSGVLFLAHLGNWDLAGRWAASCLAPVTTVAERVQPEHLYTQFVAARAALGITVLPLTGGDPPFPALLRRVRAGGLVALLADRDLTGTGTEVTLCGHRARVAPGPAALARATGAPLIPVFLRRDEKDRARGFRRYVASFGEPVAVPREGDAHGQVREATQQVADQLGVFLKAHTSDWHMLQRVFVEDEA